MKAPKAVKIAGIWVKVVYTEDLDDDRLGEYNRCYTNPTISISLDAPLNTWCMVLIHEMRHAVWHLTGHALSTMTHNKEEALNDCLDNFMGDIITIDSKSKHIRWGNVAI